MTLGFGNAVTNLFNILGRMGTIIGEIDATQSTQETNLINELNGLTAQLANEVDIQAQIGSTYISNLNALAGMGGQMQSVASLITNRMIYRDNPQPGQTLTSGNITQSILIVIKQMEAGGVTVLKQTVTATPSAFVGTGNGVVNVSVYRPFDSRMLEYLFAENIQVNCTADSYSGGATAGNEPFTIAGEGVQSNYFAFDWPKGSGASIQVNAIDGDSDNTNGNILTNSGFEEFTSNLPDNWVFTVGTGGTNVFEETGIVFDPTLSGTSLRLLGDGSVKQEFYQDFDSTSGTTGTLTESNQYSFCIFMRRDGGGTFGSGAMSISLVDDLDNVIEDSGSNQNVLSFDLTTLDTEFVAYKGVFRTPYIMPSSYRIKIEITTAIPSGRSVYLDLGSLGVMSQLYTAGPFFAVHAGSVPFEITDQAIVATTNSRGVGGTLNTFQTLLSRLFPGIIYGQEIMFPSSTTPFLIDSTLIG